MKVGVSITTSWPPRIDGPDVARQLVERAQAIRRAGLDSLFVGDHHNFPPNHYFQNVPTIARLMAETGDMTVGILYLMPLHHPLLMAEQIGTLAVMATGPLVVIAAAGYGEQQFAALGVPIRQRPSRLEENLTIVQRLLRGESVSYDGRYHKLENVQVRPVPEHMPEFWIGASGRPAIERAGRMADGWVSMTVPFGEELGTLASMYRQTAAANGRAATLVARRDVYVGESDTEAEAATAPYLARGYRGLSREALIIGGPERAIEEFTYLHSLGFDHVLVRHIVLDQAQVLASYRRLGEYVLPAVRDL